MSKKTIHTPASDKEPTSSDYERMLANADAELSRINAQIAPVKARIAAIDERLAEMEQQEIETFNAFMEAGDRRKEAILAVQKAESLASMMRGTSAEVQAVQSLDDSKTQAEQASHAVHNAERLWQAVEEANDQEKVTLNAELGELSQSLSDLEANKAYVSESRDALHRQHGEALARELAASIDAVAERIEADERQLEADRAELERLQREESFQALQEWRDLYQAAVWKYVKKPRIRETPLLRVLKARQAYQEALAADLPTLRDMVAPSAHGGKHALTQVLGVAPGLVAMFLPMTAINGWDRQEAIRVAHDEVEGVLKAEQTRLEEAERSGAGF